MNIREKILQILESVCPGIDFEAETALIDEEILDSLDIITIVSELVDEFGIELNVNDLLPEHFNSLDAITTLVSGRME